MPETEMALQLARLFQNTCSGSEELPSTATMYQSLQVLELRVPVRVGVQDVCTDKLVGAKGMIWADLVPWSLTSIL